MLHKNHKGIRNSLHKTSSEPKFILNNSIGYQTPRKIHQIVPTESTIDRTNNKLIQSPIKPVEQQINAKKVDIIQPNKKYINIVQRLNRFSTKQNMRDEKDSKRKILSLSQLKQRSGSQQSIKSRQKLKITSKQIRLFNEQDSTNKQKLNNNKSQVDKNRRQIERKIIEKDSTKYESVSQLMQNKIRKNKNNVKRFDTPIQLITQENQKIIESKLKQKW